MLVEACDSCKTLNLEEPLLPVTIIYAAQRYHGGDERDPESGVINKLQGVAIGPVEGVFGTFAKPVFGTFAKLERYCAKCLKKKMEETTKLLIAGLRNPEEPKKLVHKAGL